MLAMLLESTGTRFMLPWMRLNLGRIGGGSFCFKFPRHVSPDQMRRTRSGIVTAGWRAPSNSDLWIVRSGAETEMVSGIRSCPSHQ